MVGTNYKVLLCPECQWGTRNRRGQWRAYLTPNHLKLFCRFCGYTVRVPLDCSVCGAAAEVKGEGTEKTVVLTITDLLAQAGGDETDETQIGI